MRSTIILLLIVCLANIKAQEKNDSSSINNYKRGIYMSYQDFISNNPSNTKEFYLDSMRMYGEFWYGSYSVFPRYTSSNLRVKKVWGFCDGRIRYKYFDKKFYEVEENGGEYYFYGYDKKKEISGFFLFFGLIGYAIHNTIENNRLMSSRVKYKIIDPNDYKSPRELAKDYKIDDAEIVLFRRHRKEIDEPIEFYVGDTVNYSFTPDSYVRLNLGLEDSVTINYGNNLQHKLEIDLIPGLIKYIVCSQKENGEVNFEELDAQLGELQSGRPQRNQNRRDKLKYDMN